MIEVQDEIYKRLQDYTPLNNLLARYKTFQGSDLTESAIYTDIPQAEFSEDDSFFPYLMIGNDDINQFDTDTSDGFDFDLSIHAWTRGNKVGGYISPKRQAKQIAEKIRDALHQHELNLTESDLILLHFKSVNFIQEPDGKTYHAALRFRLLNDNI